MLLNSAILALVGVSYIVALLITASGLFALQVIRHWDLASGSERQVILEHKTYLISTLVAYALACEILSLFLFVYNAEQMSSQFVGAMCATGVLNVNAFGWPTLFLKISLFFSGILWLILNRVDNKGYDYPLIGAKYRLLLCMVPLVVAEAAVQTAFFMQMDPDVISSCCGSLFSADAQGVAAELAGLAPGTALAMLVAGGAALVASGLHLLIREKGGLLFAGTGLVTFGIALAAIVSAVSLYVYEQPHHHCPFCVLKSGHDYIGYLFYLPLFPATALAVGAGVLTRFKEIPSIVAPVRTEVRRLATWALILFILFYAVAGYAVLRSNLVLTGG